MFSKSIFGNTNTNAKTIMNPVNNTTIPFYNNELSFTKEEYSYLQKYNRLEEIDNLSNNYDEYIQLLNMLSNIEIKTKNSNIKLLLKITRKGLINTMNIFGLNIKQIELNIKNMMLENKINMIVSNKNDNHSIVSSEKNYHLEKQFSLTPIFSYYISLFGIPEEGVGFDLHKIQMIKTILEKK